MAHQKEDSVARWYVIHTYSGYENKVKTDLEKMVKNRELEDFFFEIVVPMEEQIEIKEGKRKANLKKVFPGYVLIKMIVTDETWYIVRNTRGVTGFVGSGTKPITITEEEIRMMVDVGEEKGSIQEDEKELIINVFEFNDKIVSEVMLHRTEVYAIDIKSKVDDILSDLKEYKYSRIPVYEENIDNIVGLLFIKDLLAYAYSNKEVKIKRLMRPAYFVSETKPINELFRDMQRNKQQLAVVLDEYGGTSGIISMEDIIEELVGNIFDEYDDIEKDFEKIDDNTYMINGSVSIFDLRKILGVSIPEGDYDTLSGYLIELLGRIPSDDEKPEIETEKVTYKIEDYEEKRILWVKACKNQVPEDDNNEEDDREGKEDE